MDLAELFGYRPVHLRSFPLVLFGRFWTMNVEFLSLIINAIEIGRVPRFTVKPFHPLP